MRMPEPNQLVSVLVESNGRLLATRIEDILDGAIVQVSAPSEDGELVPLIVGEHVVLQWPTPRGLIQGRGCVVASHEEVVPTFDVRFETTDLLQRREYVRAELVLDTELTREDGPDILTATLDISGSGVRVVDNGYILAEGDVLGIRFGLPDGTPVSGRAVVVRAEPEAEYALSFVELDAATREQLIRTAFAANARMAQSVRGV